MSRIQFPVDGFLDSDDLDVTEDFDEKWAASGKTINIGSDSSKTSLTVLVR